MSPSRFPRLYPAQVCFVVGDVDAAVSECVSRFGWGPFHRFTAPTPNARYREWTGPKETDVALGMAGRVQVELIHVRAGRDTVERYQSRYGAGFQHMGISCADRDEAVEALQAIGATVDDCGEHPGIRFAFVDTPTGPGMFELLQATDEGPPGGGAKPEDPDSTSRCQPLDRATIVTRDLDRAVAFYARAFRWEAPRIDSVALLVDGRESPVRRCRGRAGQLELELIEPGEGADEPYSRHLARGDHGLVHAGGPARSSGLPAGAQVEGAWPEEGEAFGLYTWAGGETSLQLRQECA